MSANVITSDVARAIGDKLDEVAAVAGGYSAEQWGELVTSGDPLDDCTVQNFRVIANRVLVHLLV